MIKISGCGDLFIAHHLAANQYDGFSELAELISSHDFKFGNLETTIHRNEGYPSLFPGGGYAMADPAVLNDLKQFGFNVLNIANNHSMDFSHNGLVATMKYLNEADIPYAGAGANLAEAAAPKYVECREGRVALISITSSFHDSDAAGHQSINVPGRPGVNPLRHQEVYEVTPDLFGAVEKIAEETGINSNIQWGIMNGYRVGNKFLNLRNIYFVEGKDNRLISDPSDKDLQRTVQSIKEARCLADCIVLSIHAHQFKGNDEIPDDFVVKFCHACVDAGADIIFGHGSHVIRGVEKYGKGIIFYGLGDFIFQNEQVRYLPSDFYEKYNMPPEYYGTVGLAMNYRSNNGTRGLVCNPNVWKSILVSVEYENGVKAAKIYPIDLRFEGNKGIKGWPVLSKKMDVIDTVVNLSETFDTQIYVENGVGKIDFGN